MAIIRMYIFLINLNRLQQEKTLHNLLHIIEKNKETLLDIDLNKPSLSEVFEFFVKKWREKNFLSWFLSNVKNRGTSPRSEQSSAEN